MNDKAFAMVSPAPFSLRGEAEGLPRGASLGIEAKFTVPDPVVY
jgi:hypothetical protein